MMLGAITRPGALTRDGYGRLHDERLHQELATLAMQVDPQQDDPMLRRRLVLLHMWLARRRSSDAGGFRLGYYGF
jgi:hypothetical protein